MVKNKKQMFLIKKVTYTVYKNIQLQQNFFRIKSVLLHKQMFSDCLLNWFKLMFVNLLTGKRNLFKWQPKTRAIETSWVHPERIVLFDHLFRTEKMIKKNR